MITTSHDMLMLPYGLTRHASAEQVTAKISELINEGSRRSRQRAARLGEVWWREVNPRAAQTAGANFYFQLALAYLLCGKQEAALFTFRMAERYPDMTNKIRGDFCRDVALYEMRGPFFRLRKFRQQRVIQWLAKAAQFHQGDEASMLMDNFASARRLAKKGRHLLAGSSLDHIRRELRELGIPDRQHYRNVTFWLMVEIFRSKDLHGAAVLAREIIADDGEASTQRKQVARSILSASSLRSGISVRRHLLGKM